MKLSERFEIQTYNVGFIIKSIDSVMNEGIKKGDIVWLKHKYRDRFFADPFLINSDDDYYYILCEEYLFFEEKGKITLLTISKSAFELKNRRVIIEEPYHLSFPYCKYRGDEIIPEACESGKSFKYKIDLETYKVLEKEEILDDGVIDATVYNKDGNVYLYATKHPNPLTHAFVYKGFNQGHFQKPGIIVISDDEEHARAAGDFFVWKGDTYRAVQDCKGRYGRQTKIMKVQAFGEKYKAEEVQTINSFENPPYNETLHTFNVYEDIIVVDGSKDFMKFPVKILYKYCRFLYKRRLR